MNLLISIVLTHGVPPDFRGGIHLFIPPTAIIGPVPSLSAGHAIAYRWRTLPKVRRHSASSPQGSSSNGCCLFRYHHGPNNVRLSFPTPTIYYWYEVDIYNILRMCDTESTGCWLKYIFTITYKILCSIWRLGRSRLKFTNNVFKRFYSTNFWNCRA